VVARRTYFAFLGATAALHGVLAAVLPISGDEAYLWDCSRHLAWSYFDLPPLMPWLIVPFRFLLGPTALAIRLPAILCSFLLGVLILSLVRRLGGKERDAAWAYLLLHATPLVFLGSFYTSTDIGMMTAFVAAITAALAIAQDDRRGWWGFALATGIGFLAKFPVVLSLPALLPAVLSPAGRRHLRSPVPYLAAGLSFICTTPVWFWSSHHHWDDFRFHLSGRHRIFGLTFQFLGDFLVANLLLASPFMAIAAGIALWKFSRRKSTESRIILVAVLFPLLFFGLISLREPVGGHWGAPSIVLAVVLLPLIAFRGRRALVIAGGASTALVVIAVIGIILFPLPLLRMKWSYQRNTVSMSTASLAWIVGNEEVASAVKDRLEPGEIMASENYTNVHLFAFLTGGTMETRLGNVKSGRSGLGSLYWYEPSSLRGRNFLVVTEKFGGDAVLRSIFREVREEPPIIVSREGRPIRTFRLLRCRQLLQPAPWFTRLAENEAGTAGCAGCPGLGNAGGP
jgi:hypothetical protein